MKIVSSLRATRFRWHLCLLLLLGCVIQAGCSKRAEPVKPGAVVEADATEADFAPDETEIALTKKLEEKRRNVATSPAARTAARKVVNLREPGPDEQRCFQCNAEGLVTCVAPGCKNGYRACPGRCLKRNEGRWVPDTAHGGMARAIKVPDGRTYFIPEGHAGEIWVYQGGQLVSTGNCPTCNARRVIRCTVCEASGKNPCELCETKGVLPAAWKPTDNPWFNRQPDVVRLKDGRVFLARDAGGDELVVMFKTRAGEIISVAREEVTQWPKKL